MKLKGNYFWLALFLSVWAFFRGWNYFVLGEWSLIFWFCFLNLILLAVGLYFRSLLLVSVAAVSSLITGIAASVDVLSFTFFGKQVFGVAGYLIESTLAAHVLTFYHLFLVIIPLYVLLKERKFYENSWIYSSLFLLLVFIVSLIFSEGNVNCVRDFCEVGIFNVFRFLKPEFMPFWIFHWLSYSLVVFIPSYFILKAVVLRERWR